MIFSQAELDMIKSTFKDNVPLLKLLRKVFLPTYDPNSPLLQGMDLWMTVDVRNLPPEQAYVRLLARNELINHIEHMLFNLNTLANMEVKTPEEMAAKQKKDSTK